MAVIVLDQQRRRKAHRPAKHQVPAKVLRLDQLADAVLLRVVKRQAAREIEKLQYIFKITGGDPTILPTPEQMEAIENGTIEY